MDRKEFIRTCGFVCLTASAWSVLLQSCGVSKIVNAEIIGTDLVIPVSYFQAKGKDAAGFRSHLVIYNERLRYPICVFRHDDNTYSALLMQCTHQGTELQVFGDRLQCPAHGSEFDNKGAVLSGPADTRLRTFPVAIGENQLKILLK